MSPPKFKLENFTYEKLSEDVDLSSFCCDREDYSGVNDFIHNQALDYQRGLYGVTYLFYFHDEIVGAATIAMGDVKTKELPGGMEADPDMVIKTFPSLLIGQLGVDNKYQKRDAGLIICEWCVGIAAELAQKVGCRYISLVTEETKIGFYEKCGFKTRSEKPRRIVMIRKLEINS